MGLNPQLPRSFWRTPPALKFARGPGPFAAVTSRRQLAGGIQAWVQTLKVTLGPGPPPPSPMSPKGHAARLRPIRPASRGEKGTGEPYARVWTQSPQARAAPLGPESTRPPVGGPPRPRQRQSTPALPGAPARTHLDVLVLVLAFPAVPAGSAAAPHLPHRVFHGERVGVYGRERAALVPAST